MAPLKFLGLDGFETIFYQTYWKEIGEEVSNVALDFLYGGAILPFINYSFIALILKVPNFESIIEFIPINLCNIMYTLIAKILVNKLKKYSPLLSQ